MDLANLTLIFTHDAKFIFVPAERIDQDEQITLELLPGDAKKAAFLADLKQHASHRPLAVAFGNTAVEGQLKAMTSVHRKAGDSWTLRISVSESSYSPFDDFTFNGCTPDDVAELRARKILLNEMPALGRVAEKLSAGLITSMVSQHDGFIKEIRSPIPELFKLYGKSEYFPVAARLMGILYLKVTRTVEHIFKLDIRVTESGEIAVDFEGQRPSRYSNVEPTALRVKGFCSLD